MAGDSERVWSRPDGPMSEAPAREDVVRTHDLLPHRPALTAYLRRRMGAGQDVEDMVQDVYLRVLATPPAEPVKSWRGFLLRIASNLLIDQHRRRAARMAEEPLPIDEGMIDEHSHSPERIAGEREALARVGTALADASPVARDAFLLVRVEGLSHKEAAARLGITPKAVSHHVERTLARLAARLGDLSA